MLINVKIIVDVHVLVVPTAFGRYVFKLSHFHGNEQTSSGTYFFRAIFIDQILVEYQIIQVKWTFLA